MVSGKASYQKKKNILIWLDHPTLTDNSALDLEKPGPNGAKMGNLGPIGVKWGQIGPNGEAILVLVGDHPWVGGDPPSPRDGR